MTRVFLVDDEPLVLIGMQGMLDWAALGCEVAGTARNGAEALRLIPDARPDVVISDIRMPVLDGFGLAEALRRQDAALPALIMLTSYEEFDYVKRSMQFGAVEYLIKMELTAETLTAALQRAKEAVAKETALRRPPAAATGSLESYRERLFLQLYGGLYTDRPSLDAHAAELGLHFDAPCYTVAVGALQVRELPTSQLATLSTGVTRMAAETLPKYAPCHVTGLDLHSFSVLFPLQSAGAPEELLGPLLQKVGHILYNYFSTGIYWSVGRVVPDILQVRQSQQDALAALPLLGQNQTAVFYHDRAHSQLDHRAQLVAQVQQYIQQHLAERLSLNDVAAVFNFSPNYLSQLFAQNSESGFVEFVTSTRITAAKTLMATTELKIYEISDQVGFESAFYFSKVFKKLEGVSPREYMQKVRSE